MFGPSLRKAALIAVILAVHAPFALARGQKTLSESIEIDASPQTVFETIRKYRTCDLHHRQLVSFDGKKALIKEDLDDVPIYGKVHCLWQESEVPYQRIDYTLVNSDKFTSGGGSYIVQAGKVNGTSTLELDSALVSGLHVPLANEITECAERKDMKVRLQLLKQMAESTKLSEVARSKI